MPRGDGTGPMGIGPMTGRAAGICAGFGVPGYMNPGPAWGYGRGRAFGRGRSFRIRGCGFGPGFGRRAGWWAAPYQAAPPGWW